MLLTEYWRLARLLGHMPKRSLPSRWRWLTSANTTLPVPVNYVIVGTQKGGTSSLQFVLSKHPDICTAVVKETHFFDSDPSFQASHPDYRRYHDLFRHYRGETAVGEATPIYMYAPYVAERLHRYNPDTKLIFVLRNPSERAYSHYQMIRRAGLEPLSFSEAIRLEPVRLESSGEDYGPRSPRALHSYVSRGFYATQIERMLDYFPRSQMLFLRSDALRREHDETLARVHDFLGVERLAVPQASRLVGQYEPIAPDDKNQLLRLYANEVERLEHLTGWDLSSWQQ